MRKVLAWLWFLLFAFALVLGAVAFAQATPEELAFALGLFGFLMLANPLLFGYAGLLGFLAELRQGSARAETVAAALHYPIELLRELAALPLAALWLKELAPYRYAYYGLFLLLLMVAVAPQLSGGVLGLSGVLAGALWGAALPTAMVFGLELAASWQLAALLREGSAT